MRESKLLLPAAFLALGMAALQVNVSSSMENRVAGEFTLQLADGGNLDHILRKYDLIPVDEFGPYRRVRVKNQDAPLLSLQDLQDHEGLEWADYLHRQHTPESALQMVVAVVGSSIEEYRGQKLASHLDLAAIHAVTKGAGAVVAVVDTGVYAEHKVLTGHVLSNGYDFVDNDNNPNDSGDGFDGDDDGLIDEAAGHGTLVAGTILLTAPECSILPIRVMDDEGNGTAFDVAQGIFYAIDQGAHIINLSIGLPEHSQIINQAIVAAHEAGVVLVAAAGNMGIEFPPYFPASSPFTLSVASVGMDDVKSSFSNYHKTVTMTAPGENILGPFWNGGWAIGAGTSFSTPFVSGQAALVYSARPETKKLEMEILVKKGTINIDDVYGNDEYRGKLGQGRFDAKETLEQIENMVSTIPADSRVADGLSTRAVPNPASVGETVLFATPRSADGIRARADIYSAAGRHVRTLSGSGESLAWDGNDSLGRLAPAGTYFVQLRNLSGSDSRALRVVRVARP